MTAKTEAWGWRQPNGELEPCAFYLRWWAMDFAVARCMGSDTYKRLGTLSARWRYAYRRGHRIVRIELRPISEFKP